MRTFKDLIDLFFLALGHVFPRFRNKIVFGAWHGTSYSDNPKFLFEFLFKHPEFRIVWIGNRSVAKTLPPVPEDFRSAYHVELHEGGYLPDEEYRALLSEPGVYIAPRFTEGIGMSFLEALAAGKFVVAHKDATMDEAIDDGVTGRLVDMRNPMPIQLSAADPAMRFRRFQTLRPNRVLIKIDCAGN